MHGQEKKAPTHYLDLNAMLNLYGEDGKIQFEKDKEAANQYFLQHVNQNTVFFHDLKEKLDYLVENKYYEKETLDLYSFEFIKSVFKRIYAHKFRFQTFMGAFKYYTGYTLKTFDGERYLERFEDRVAMTALFLADGDEALANDIADTIIKGQYQPATPTILNAGKAQRGELVSCFLLEIYDGMNEIGRALNSGLQLSKLGGGVAFNLTNLREAGAPIKMIENAASGIIPVMKIFEDAFSYANQLGQRQGSGACYLSMHHPDFEAFLDTKKENADEKIRIKTLSIGAIVTDIVYQAAEKNEDIYQFSPYDVERVYGVPFGKFDITKNYQELVNNPEIRKYRVNPRLMFQRMGEIQPESGYPYIMNVDTVNRANPIKGWVSMSNLCSEILQISTVSKINDDQTYEHLGRDISCNLGSLNIAKVMDDAPNIGKIVETATRSLTTVAVKTNIDAVPSIRNGNEKGHSIGLGQMNLHGFLGRERIHYDSVEALDFTNLYFATINYYSILASCQIAQERNQVFEEFSESKYASGEYFDFYTEGDWIPKTTRIKELFEKFGFQVPTNDQWRELKALVMEKGLFHMYRLATPPTGSISYINNSTSSIHPIAAKIEVRKEGKTGRKYYPAPYMNNDNLEYFKTAYEYGPKAVIDVYAAATPHVDQGLSLTVFYPATATTRTINQSQIYAHKRGIKTIYYVRMEQQALEGTEVESCVSCTL